MTSALAARYVLDASVIAKWFTRHDEEDRGNALTLRELHRERRSELVVPDLCLLEVANAVRFSPRAEEADGAAVVSALERIGLRVVPLDWDLLRRATSIAWTDRLTLYDALYVALAERLGCPLVTADETLSRRVRGRGTAVSLREIPLFR